MDRLDRQIIEKLVENGQLTNTAMARDVGVSEETVRRRLKRLTSENVLKIVAIPNHAMLGMGTKALLGFRTDPGLVDQAAGIIAENSAVQWVLVTTGPFDIMAEVVVTDVGALYEVIQHLGKIVAVEAISTMMVLETAKRPYVGIGRNGTA